MTKANELRPHTFKDTGKTVLIRKVSPMLAMQLRRDFPAPTPPKVQVTIGEGIDEWEDNPADPDYLKRVQLYEQDFSMKSQRLLIRRGVVVEMTDEIKAEVEALRKEYREEFEKEIDGTDSDVYINMLCIGTGEDLQELVQAIMSRSQPTEQEVALAQASFRG